MGLPTELNGKPAIYVTVSDLANVAQYLASLHAWIRAAALCLEVAP